MGVRLEALPELVNQWALLEELARSEGITIAIANLGGLRTEADTTDALTYKQADYNAYAARERAAGRTPLPITGGWDYGGSSRPIAPFGQSWHNYGAARDFRVVSKPAALSTADAEQLVAAIGESIGLRSGQSYGDVWHLELPYSLETVRDMWAEYSAAASSSSSGAASMTGVWLTIAFGVGVLAAIRYAGGLVKWH